MRFFCISARIVCCPLRIFAIWAEPAACVVGIAGSHWQVAPSDALRAEQLGRLVSEDSEEIFWHFALRVRHRELLAGASPRSSEVEAAGCHGLAPSPACLPEVG